MGEILDFPARLQTTAGDLSPSGPVRIADKTVRIADKDESRLYPSGSLSTGDLYPLRDALSGVISKVFDLLAQARQRIDRSVAALRQGDHIGSDDEINRLQALLPELFCCRSIGDGFGEVVTAIHYAITNMDGAPLDERQLLAVGRLFRRVETEPFVNADEAVNEIMLLEDAGLIVEPRSFAELSELFGE
jgi:DNA-binding FadR family transcriptional regulator